MSRSRRLLDFYLIGMVPSSLYIGVATYRESTKYKIPARKSFPVFVLASALYPLSFSYIAYMMYRYDLELPGTR